MSSDKKHRTVGLLELLVAFATVIGTCVAVIELIPAFGQWLNPRSQIVSNTPFPIATATSITSTTIPTSPTKPSQQFSNIFGSIPFANPNDPNVLNPVFQWIKGGSETNSYDLTINPEALIVISGPRLNQYRNTQTAPLISLPYSGDFQVQVKVIFHPVEVHQVAGLGILSRSEQTTSYIRIARMLTDWGQGISFQTSSDNGNYFRYTGEITYLKIERNGALFNIYYSFDGNNWINLQKDFVFGFPDNIEVFLATYSSSNNGIIAEFQDFIIEPINK